MLYVHANRTDCYYIRDRVLHWFSPLSLCLMANIFFAFIFRFVPCCELSCFAFLVFVPFCMLNWQEQSLQFWFRSFLYAELAEQSLQFWFVPFCMLNWQEQSLQF